VEDPPAYAGGEKSKVPGQENGPEPGEKHAQDELRELHGVKRYHAPPPDASAAGQWR
jgi:hypothetical protein